MYHELARKLRKNMTDAERRLWSRLRGEQFGGFKFRRQAPIGSFIVDFVCFERKVVIELDGGQHRLVSEQDEARTDWLNSQGFRVLRYWNHEVFEDLDSILEATWLALKTAPGEEVSHWETPHPNPPPQGGRGSERARSQELRMAEPVPYSETPHPNPPPQGGRGPERARSQELRMAEGAQ